MGSSVTLADLQAFQPQLVQNICSLLFYNDQTLNDAALVGRLFCSKAKNFSFLLWFSLFATHSQFFICALCFHFRYFFHRFSFFVPFCRCLSLVFFIRSFSSIYFISFILFLSYFFFIFHSSFFFGPDIQRDRSAQPFLRDPTLRRRLKNPGEQEKLGKRKKKTRK
jgi:hypothetical protein